MYASLCLGLLVLTILGAAGSHRHGNDVSPEHETAIEDERKLLVQCQHPDYRAYIKCLKREKRQHHANGVGNSRACLDECFERNCTNSTCLRDCHSHCRKRLIETYSKTVETSFDCAEGECNEVRGSGTPNITTIVNIKNVMPNSTNCGDNSQNPCETKCSHGGSNCNGTKCGHCGQDARDTNEDNQKPQLPPKIDINNVINNQFGPGFYPSADCACPGCNCYPTYNPWQSSPQITIGIGGGPLGGCIYPTPWPCFQRYPAPPVDCSVCHNPFMRYRCDPACPPDPRRNYTLAPTTERFDTPNQWRSNGN